MKAVVTGGAGFIGSHIADALIKQNHEVIVIDNFFWKTDNNIKHLFGNPAFTLHKMDINQDLRKILAGAEVIFHEAAIPPVQYSIDHPQETNTANIDGTLNLLSCAKDAGVRRVVFASSAAIYGDQPQLPFTEDMLPNPASPYAAQKITGEHYCKLFYELYGLETVSLRYFNVYGPRQNPESNYANLVPRSIKKLLQNEAITIFGDGNQTRDFIYVGDIVEANLAAGFSKTKSCLGTAFNIASGRKTSVNEIVNTLTQMRPGKTEHLPPRQEPRDSVADIKKAQKLLAWSPRISLKEGLAQTFAFVSNASRQTNSGNES